MILFAESHLFVFVDCSSSVFFPLVCTGTADDYFIVWLVVREASFGTFAIWDVILYSFTEVSIFSLLFAVAISVRLK